MSPSSFPRISWPEGKAFAFTVFDDTDHQTLSNAPAVYDLLYDLGFRTTKSVWPIRGPHTPTVGGSTCEDLDYLAWVKNLQQKGFEISLHNVTYHTSPREQTASGFDRFRNLFGHDPHTLANHADCQEAIYWGDARVSGINRVAYNLLNRFKTRGQFQGHVEGSQLFWGDICRKRVKYVRNFVFLEINTLKACPSMPYHDPNRPYVNYWFASSEGPNVRSFTERLSEENQDRLEAEGGVCIMYTHFGYGFCENGRVDPRFKSLMTRLSQKNGYFVPVSTLLDFLLAARGHKEISNQERAQIERRWLLSKIRVGGRS